MNDGSIYNAVDLLGNWNIIRMKTKKLVTMCDPPGGWKYGFPKPMPVDNFPSQEAFHAWLISRYYPQEEIQYWLDSEYKSVPCKFWQQEIEEGNFKE